MLLKAVVWNIVLAHCLALFSPHFDILVMWWSVRSPLGPVCLWIKISFLEKTVAPLTPFGCKYLSSAFLRSVCPSVLLPVICAPTKHLNLLMYGSDFSFNNISFWMFSLFCGFAQLCCCSIPIFYWCTVKLHESTASLVAWFAWICPLKQYPPSECLNVGFSQQHLVAVSVWNVDHQMQDCIEYLWIFI